jgi:hypothetical protein
LEVFFMESSDNPLADVKHAMGQLESVGGKADKRQAAVLMAAHRRFMDYQLKLLLARYHRELIEPFRRSPLSEPPITEELVARATGLLTQSESRQVAEIEALGSLDSECSEAILRNPQFNLLSPPELTGTPQARTTLSRGNFDGSLEVAASTGHFPRPARNFPGSPTLGGTFNTAIGSVGHILEIPTSNDFRLLDALIVVELQQTQGRQPPSWDNFMFVVPSLNADLALGGMSICSCDIVLTVNSAEGRASTVSTMANSTVSAVTKLHVNGDMTKVQSLRAVLHPQISTLGVFVDARAFSWAESPAEEGEAGDQGFAELSVHHRAADEDLLAFGAAIADGALRVTQLLVRICPVPVI